MPFVVDLGEDGAGQAEQGGRAGEHADHVGTSFDFTEETGRSYTTSVSVRISGGLGGSLHHFLPFVAGSPCAATEAGRTGRRGLIGAWHRPH